MKTLLKIETLSWQRLEEAKVLYENTMYEGAFYLAGYSVELMLKAKICTKFTLESLFDEKDVSVNVLEGIGEIRRAVKTHNLFVLLTFSGLRESFEIQAETKPDFEKIRTLLFEVWTEQSRYNAVGTTQQNEIKQIIEYLGSQTEGILQWIRKS